MYIVDGLAMFSIVHSCPELLICSASTFGRAIVMPNLKPPITTTAAAVAYRDSILKALPSNSNFIPLMTLYLTDTMSPNEIKLASKSLLSTRIFGRDLLVSVLPFVSNLYLVIFWGCILFFLLTWWWIDRKKWGCLCCKIVSCRCYDQFPRWCYRSFWEVSTCSWGDGWTGHASVGSLLIGTLCLFVQYIEKQCILFSC